jgi:hypothetical protein
VSDSYHESTGTTDTAYPDTRDTFNNYRQDDPPEAASNSYYESAGTTGPDTYSYYQQDEPPESEDDQYGDAFETSSYYDDDYDYEETLDETKARIESQENQPGPQGQYDAAPGSTSQPELTAEDVTPGLEDGNDVPASQESRQSATDQSSLAGTPDSGPRPPDNGQGSEPEASDARQPGAACGGTDAALKQDDGPGTPAGQDNQSPQNEQPEADAAGTLIEPALPGQDTEGQSNNDNIGPDAQDVLTRTQDGQEVHVGVVDLPPEARTLGDTTVSGVGRKPTGDELFHTDGDDPAESRLDRLLKKATEGADDLHDGVGNAAEAVYDFNLHPPGGGHALEGHPVYEPHAPDGPAVTDIVGGVTLVGVAVLAGARHWLSDRRKGSRR